MGRGLIFTTQDMMKEYEKAAERYLMTMNYKTVMDQGNRSTLTRFRIELQIREMSIELLTKSRVQITLIIEIRTLAWQNDKQFIKDFVYNEPDQKMMCPNHSYYTERLTTALETIMASVFTDNDLRQFLSSR